MAVGVGVTIWGIVLACAQGGAKGPTYDVGEAVVGVQVLASPVVMVFSLNRATCSVPLGPARSLGGGPSRLTPTVSAAGGGGFCCQIVLMLWWSWLFFTGHWAS